MRTAGRIQSALISALFMLFGAIGNGDNLIRPPFFCLATIFLCAEIIALGVKNRKYPLSILLFLMGATMGFFLGKGIGALLFLIFIMNIAYALPQLKLSSSNIAPFYLTANYVIIPYLIGALAVFRGIKADDFIMILTLAAFFLAKTGVKDFFEKNKNKNYQASLILLVFGLALLFVNFFDEPLFVVGLIIYPLMILLIILRLANNNDRLSQLVAINIIIRIGYGMLLTLLGMLIFKSYDADIAVVTIFYLSIILPHFYMFAKYLKGVESFKIGARK